MPQLKDDLGLEGATIKELTTEQLQRSDAEYLKHVNKGLKAAVTEANEGDMIDHDDALEKLNSEFGLTSDVN